MRFFRFHDGKVREAHKIVPEYAEHAAARIEIAEDQTAWFLKQMFNS